MVTQPDDARVDSNVLHHIKSIPAITVSNTKSAASSLPLKMAQQEVQLTDLNPNQLQEVKRQLEEVRFSLNILNARS